MSVTSWQSFNFNPADYLSSSDDEKEPNRKRKADKQEVDGVKKKSSKPRRITREKKVSQLTKNTLPSTNLSPEISQKIKQLAFKDRFGVPLKMSPLIKVTTKESAESPEVVREGRVSMILHTSSLNTAPASLSLDDQVNEEHHSIATSKITSIQDSDRQILADFLNQPHLLHSSDQTPDWFLGVQTKDNQVHIGQLTKVNEKGYKNSLCQPASFTIRTFPIQDSKASNEIQFRIDSFDSLKKLSHEECKDIEFKRKNLFHSAVAEGTLMIKPLADIAAEYIREFPIEWETPPQQPDITQPLDI